MFARAEYDAVLAAIDRFYRKYPLDDVNWPYLVFRGDSQFRLGETDAALETLLGTPPYVRRIQKVEEARRWARVFFLVGALHARRQEWVEGIAAVEDGLRLSPESSTQWFALGEMFSGAGDRPRALAFFRGLLAALPLRGELRAVAALKLERLGEPAAAPEVPDFSGALLFPGARIRLLPVGPQDHRIVLPDLCLLVQSKWWLACEALPPVAMPEALPHEEARRQRDADRLLGELGRQPLPGARPGDVVIAVVADDLYAPSIPAYATHTFALPQPQSGIAVVSTSRFVTGLEDAYEPQVVAMRRVGIQLLSTVGSLLGLRRAAWPECPTTPARDLDEFRKKDSRLSARPRRRSVTRS